MSDMGVTLSVVLFLIGLVLVVACARLRIWSDKSSRLLTIALFLDVLAVATTRPVFDNQVDSALSGIVGYNSSDLLHVLLLVARYWLIGLLALRAAARWQIGWTAFVGALSLALIVTSRVGHARRIPIFDEWELRDAPSVAYNVIYALVAGATCTLVITAAAAAIRERRGIQRGPLLALAAVGVIGMAYSLTTVTLLIAAPEVLRENAAVIVRAWSVPLNVALAVAGLYGLRRDRSTAVDGHRDRSARSSPPTAHG
jgi:hypothetical protein